MAIVAIDDGLAIMIFGLAISITQQFIGHTGDPIYLAIGKSVLEIVQSLFLGLITGVCLSVIVGRMRNVGEIMTAGLSLLLLCSELAIYLHLSPLLAGMTAGFTLVNKATKDVRIFRALNKFEPPIYVLFFTLAGTHLDIKALEAAGIIGIVYFLARIAGKVIGVSIGARISKTERTVRKYLGFALVPQAGVAIGLIFLISSEPTLSVYASIITPVVLAGVFLSELLGPLSARYAVTKAGEIGERCKSTSSDNKKQKPSTDDDRHGQLVPWSWEHLKPHQNPKDIVAFGAANKNTVAGLARTATILAHYFGATPMAVRVDATVKNIPKEKFSTETKEVEGMGYSLFTEHVPDQHIASGLVAAIEYNSAKAVVLGYPLNDDVGHFQKTLETVAKHVFCPVVVIRFYGLLHTEKILIPVTDLDDIEEVYQIICAFNSVGEHQIKILYMMSSTVEPREIDATESEVKAWLRKQSPSVDIDLKAVPTESRVDAITTEAESFDLVVMGATTTRGVKRFFFGSLADAVSKELRKPLIIVYNAKKS